MSLLTKSASFVCLIGLTSGSGVSLVYGATLLPDHKTVSENTAESESTKLTQLITQAITRDDWMLASYRRESSMLSQGESAGHLPDPQIKFGVGNLAADSLAFDQEPMSQLVVGITQMFPRGNSLSLKQQRWQAQAALAPLQRAERAANIELTLTTLWLEAYEASASAQVIEKNRALFDQLLDVSRASYSSALGRTRQTDLVQAEVELIRLDDKLTRLAQQQAMREQALSEWLPVNNVQAYLASQQPLIAARSSSLYGIDVAPDDATLAQYFVQHPSVRLITQQAQLSDFNIALAQQAYKPQWGVSASYGYRADALNGADRADLLSFGVSFDMPLFAAKAQDASVSAARYENAALTSDKTVKLRQLVTKYRVLNSNLLHAKRRATLYRESLIPQLMLQIDAALSAYTYDDGEFISVVKARIAMLNAELDAIAIHIETQKYIASLNYLFADSSPADFAALTTYLEQGAP